MFVQPGMYSSSLLRCIFNCYISDEIIDNCHILHAGVFLLIVLGAFIYLLSEYLSDIKMFSTTVCWETV